MKRVPREHVNRNFWHEQDRRALKRKLVLLACGVALCAGFAFAAQRQYAAVRYGYRSEELRREREQLLAERRRLLVALEETSSPAQLERAAREIGLELARPAQVGTEVTARRADAAAADSSRRDAVSAFVGASAATVPMRR